MTENKDLPAFPMLDTNNHDGDLILELRYEGLTKREYFAGLALQGLLANNWSGYSKNEDECEVLAGVAVNFAESLIVELNKTKP